MTPRNLICFLFFLDEHARDNNKPGAGVAAGNAGDGVTSTSIHVASFHLILSCVPAAANMFATGHRCSTCSANCRTSSIVTPSACTKAVPETSCSREGCSGRSVIGNAIAPRSSLQADSSKSMPFSFASLGHNLRATKAAVACLHPTNAAKRCSTGWAPSSVCPCECSGTSVRTRYVCKKAKRFPFRGVNVIQLSMNQ